MLACSLQTCVPSNEDQTTRIADHCIHRQLALVINHLGQHLLLAAVRAPQHLAQAKAIIIRMLDLRALLVVVGTTRTNVVRLMTVQT